MARERTAEGGTGDERGRAGVAGPLKIAALLMMPGGRAFTETEGV
ncbi:hypothetical protein [Candidatus Solincola tengchongensis]|nr:hypothetical protein [Candidatus Solincola tengchongensis]